MSGTPLVTVRASSIGSKCPFGNSSAEFQLFPSGCCQLQGSSGLGKTTIAMHLAGLLPSSVLNKLQIKVECDWNPDLAVSERCGVLFQQTTLLDELTVAGNLCVALENCPNQDPFRTEADRNQRIKRLLETVGLDYARDAGKRVTELSGGMGRRACLALQLAQKKHIIVLDEPFTGLDREAAVSVAKELIRLRKNQGTALLLISHEPEISKIVMGGDDKNDTLLQGTNQTVVLYPPTKIDGRKNHSMKRKPNLFGTTFRDRLLEKLADYLGYSLPLIALAFIACGLAVALLSADLLVRLDVTDKVLAIVNQEVKPLLKMLTGEDPSVLTMMGVNMKVRGMLDKTMPEAKATLYALGMVKLFVLEVGPLLTALLLAGRIGGSYSGKVATMQATSQNKLLQTLGINPVSWTLLPSIIAALVASAALTTTGTAIALFLGSIVGTIYDISDHNFFLKQLRESVFPVLRLRSFAPIWMDDVVDIDNATGATLWKAFSALDLRPTSDAGETYIDTIVEIMTYPPVYHLSKAITYMIIIIGVAEVCARWQPDLTPRGVPFVITSSVVMGGLLVIFADWGFSQFWLLRR